MPVLLEPDRAPALSELLKAIPGGLVQRVVQGSGDFVDPPIAGLGALTSAGPSEISFIVHAKYLPQMSQTRACAVIVLPEIDEQYLITMGTAVAAESGAADGYAMRIEGNSTMVFAARIWNGVIWRSVYGSPIGSIKFILGFNF